MALTVEPGLYVAPDDDTGDEQWRGSGIRIEDDVLITNGAAKVLSEATPRTIQEIEDWMSGESASSN